MTDHLVEPTKMVCPHCGLPFRKTQNDILSFGCGSSFEETFRPQWARSMTCLEIENGQLREMFRKANLHALDLAERINLLMAANSDVARIADERDRANDHIKRLEEAGDAMAQDHNPFTFIDWQRAKEAKP
jgi:uncharacterized protein YdcH (DUF465 family)